MRVLYINHTRKISGAGLSLATLLKYLAQDIERYFWVSCDCEIQNLFGAIDANVRRDRFLCEFPTTMYNRPYSVSLYGWHFLKGVAAIFRVGEMLRLWQIDIVHINETTLFAYACAAAFHHKSVVLHARTALTNRPIERFFIRHLARLSHLRIVAIDEEVKKSFPPVCQPLIEVVYNPIETSPFPPADQTATLREKWGISPSDIVVGQIASLHSQKGIWSILDIAETLCAEISNLRFVLFGDTSPEAGEGEVFKEAIEKRGLENRVILPGYHTDLALAYSTLDIALCLFGEGLGGVGRTAYEAALYGKPLVATLPDPGKSSTLKNRETSLLFIPGDKSGIIDGIRELARNPSYRAALGKRAKEILGERHKPIKIAAQITKIYNDILKPVGGQL